MSEYPSLISMPEDDIVSEASVVTDIGNDIELFEIRSTDIERDTLDTSNIESE